MKIKEHTRNQKRMYRIHKQEEKIHDLELLVGTLQQENKKYKEVIDKEINDLDIIIDIVREKPFGDRWIINRLEANKNILKEVE